MLAPLLLSLLLSAAPASAANAYAPVPATCPTTSLVRAASGLSDGEEAYIISRKAVADVALKAWLVKTSSAFGTGNLPAVALTTSGGGYKSLFSRAGVVHALDSRDNSSSVNGLYQAMTFQAGLSSGGWMLSSMAVFGRWHFSDSLLDPSFLSAAVAYAKIVANIAAKDAADYDVSLTDIWGRLLSYQLFSGSNGGVAVTMSSLTGLSNFTAHSVSYSIITALGTKGWEGECAPGPNATTYECRSYELGSWDKDVGAFTPMKYLGTAMKGGKPSGTKCTTNFDNLGLVLSTSSSYFNKLCLSVPDAENSITNISDDLAVILDAVHEVTTSDLYGSYPNPFYNYKSSTATLNVHNNVSAQENQALVDGGKWLQNNPIFPLPSPPETLPLSS